MIPWLRHFRLPIQAGMSRLTALVCGIALHGCTPPSQPIVMVTVNGITSDLVTETVQTTLNGQKSVNSLDTVTRRLDHIELRLAETAVGTLGIAISAQGSDGCTARAGKTSVDITGPGNYSASVDLADEQGCTLVVRKEGDGAARVTLSDGTAWTFSPPEPPEAMCPIDLIVGTSMQKAFPFGTKLELKSDTAWDIAPDSYIAGVEGCTQSAAGCGVTIGADKVQVTVRAGRNTVCSNDQVCWEHPRPQGLHLRRIKGSNNDDIWASGDGAILHWEGTYWSSPRRARLPNMFSGIVSADLGSAVFVGNSGTVSRLISDTWSCVESMGSQDLRAAWGQSATDFWVVGGQGTLAHWNGTAWTTSPIAGSVELWAISGTSASNIWAVGDGSTVLHYDGTSWNKVSLGASIPTTLSLRGVYANPEGEVWIVGDGGTSLSVSGGKTTTWATGTTAKLNDIFAIPGQAKWAVGDSGTLLRHDGKSWSPVDSGTKEALNSLWGAENTSIWAVGNYGTLLRFNGVFWTVASSARKTQNLYALGSIPAASSTGNPIFVVGDQGTVMSTSGADWLLDPNTNGITTRTLRAVSTTPTNLWFAGDAGTIVYRDFALRRYTYHLRQSHTAGARSPLRTHRWLATLRTGNVGATLAARRSQRLGRPTALVTWFAAYSHHAACRNPLGCAGRGRTPVVFDPGDVSVPHPSRTRNISDVAAEGRCVRDAGAKPGSL